MDKKKFWAEVKGWTLTILAVLAFRAFLFEAVYIPSGSMLPTLQIGDYVVVQKWAYGARIPFTETAQLTWSSPKRGDIVVLLNPSNPSSTADDLIKRVVGVAGDTVEIRDGHLAVNGELVPRETLPGPCTYWDRQGGDRRGEKAEWSQEPCADYLEHLEGHAYHTHCTPDAPTCGNVLPQVVPPGAVFLAGDHRDHSQDSRYFGAVAVGRIKGRAWLAMVSWGPHGLRWDRLFHLVNH